jgi:hypothetical protein
MYGWRELEQPIERKRHGSSATPVRGDPPARLLGFTEVWYLGALLSMGMRSVAHALPFSTSASWLLCVTFWAGAYLIVERAFNAIELPREKTMNRFAEEY